MRRQCGNGSSGVAQGKAMATKVLKLGGDIDAVRATMLKNAESKGIVEEQRNKMAKAFDEKVKRDKEIAEGEKRTGRFNGPPLSTGELKSAVQKRFYASSEKELKESNLFLMATNDYPDLKKLRKSDYEELYRKYVDFLPDERYEVGPDTMNGVNTKKYFRPWEAMGLDNETATDRDIKDAYRRLSKQYHPDNKETGDREMFERLNVMYRSITTKF